MSDSIKECKVCVTDDDREYHRSSSLYHISDDLSRLE